MSKGNGYLIPVNAQPTENRCLRVFVPDDPLYIASFLGALTYFGQWTAWERDKEKRGQFAARAWRDANELTIDGLSIPCGDYPLTDDEMSDILDKLDEISERLKELEDMDVIVTQTVNGCGCCDGDTSGTTQTVVNPIIDPTDTGIDPAYDDTVYTVADAVKCRTANWLADTIISVIRRLADIGTMEIVIVIVFGAVGQIVTMLDGIPLNGIFWGVVLITIAGAIVALSNLDDFELIEMETLADEIESMKEEFVCVLYGWSTASELSSALLGFLYSRVDETATAEGWDTDAVEFIKSIFDKLFGSRFSNHIAQNVGAIVPADFIAQYDCLCGATGDSCPDINLVLNAVGQLPDGDLTGTTQGFASQFNPTTGYYEVIFELAANYCVTIDNATYTPEEMHEKCSDGVMVASDGSCIRRFTARSQAPFATAVTFESISTTCGDCNDPPETGTACKDYALEAPFSLGGGGPTVYDVDHVQMTSPVDYNDIPQWDGWVNEKVLDWLTYNNETPVAVWVFINLPINMRVTVQQWHDGGVSDYIHDEILQAGSGWYRLPTPVSWAFDGLSQRDLEIKFRNDFNVATSIRLDKICIEF